MGKRVELPKADAFFGGAPPETRVADVIPQYPSVADAATEADGPGIGMKASPEKTAAGRASRGVRERGSGGAVPEGEPVAVVRDDAADVEKVTLYLPPDIIRQLEVARVDLLLRYGTKVNRSRIAAAILRQTLEDISQHTSVGDRLVESLSRA